MSTPNIWTDEQAPAGSYVTGGLVVVTGLTTIQSFSLTMKTVGAALGQVKPVITFSGPNATIILMRENFDRLTISAGLTGLPAGISTQMASGGTYDTNSHTHDMNHNHGVSPASTTPAGATAETLAAAAQPNATTHTHTVDLPNFVQDMVAETAHTHTWNNIYQHQHVRTITQTDLSLTELANGTSFSGTVFNYFAIGT